MNDEGISRCRSRLPNDSLPPTMQNLTDVIGNTVNALNRSIGGKGLRNCSRPVQLGPRCGDCNVHCIFSATNLVFFIGVVANFVVLYCVTKDKRLHKATFVAIAGLALADMLFLLMNMAMSINALLVRLVCVENQADTKWTKGVIAILWKSATFHVAFLAVVRYIILVHPFKARTLLTNRRIIVSDVLIWLFAGIYYGIIRLASFVADDQSNTTQNRMRIANWCVSYFLPITITCVLHISKIISVWTSIKAQRELSITSAHSQTLERLSKKQLTGMARIITMVIAAEVLLPLPRFIVFILDELTEVRYPNVDVEVIVKGISYLLYLLNFSINPFIYSFKSEQFRTSLKSLFCRGNSLREKYKLSKNRTQNNSIVSVCTSLNSTSQCHSSVAVPMGTLVDRNDLSVFSINVDPDDSEQLPNQIMD